MPFLDELAGTTLNKLVERWNSDEPLGVSTGLAELDEMFGGGFIRQELSYLVGDSGVGKSWLAVAWAVEGASWLSKGNRPATGFVVTDDSELQRLVSNKQNKPQLIVFWSLEMPPTPIGIRLISQASTHVGYNLDSKVLRRGGEYTQYPEFLASISAATGFMTTIGKYCYFEFDATTVAEFRSVLTELSIGYDIVMVYVDYFRLIEDIAMDGNMATLQAERSGKLRGISRDYDCHVMSIIDINREGEKSKTSAGAQYMKGGTAAKYDSDLVLYLSVHEDSLDKATGMVLKTDEVKLVLSIPKGRSVPQSMTTIMLNRATGKLEQWRDR